jgi:hypothetical protein
MLNHRKAYESQLDSQMEQWQVEIDLLKAKTKRSEADYDDAIYALQRKHDEAGHHLCNLKDASDDTWESAKVGTDKAWLEIKAMFQISAGTP